MICRHNGNFTWQGVDVLPYKEDNSPFRSITRQVLFRGTDDLNFEFRYFEIGPGGHSTLERHQHQHAVMVLRGRGRVLVRDEVSPIGEQDVVHIAPLTWHQFRADEDSPLGFLCIVCVDRDRPQLPTAEDLAMLRSNPVVGEFIRPGGAA